MINESLVEEIRRLLAADQLSNRKIARLVGVSRSTVDQIAGGQRPDYGALRAVRRQWDEPPASVAERCPSCGGKVYLPCRLCRVRHWQAVHAARPRARRRGARQPPSAA